MKFSIIIILFFFLYLDTFSQEETSVLLCKKVVQAIIKNDSITFKNLLPPNKLVIRELNKRVKGKLSEKFLIEVNEVFDNYRKRSTIYFRKARQQYLNNNIDLSDLKFEFQGMNFNFKHITMTAKLNNKKFKHLTISVLPLEEKYYLHNYIISFSESY